MNESIFWQHLQKLGYFLFQHLATLYLEHNRIPNEYQKCKRLGLTSVPRLEFKKDSKLRLLSWFEKIFSTLPNFNFLFCCYFLLSRIEADWRGRDRFANIWRDDDDDDDDDRYWRRLEGESEEKSIQGESIC